VRASVFALALAACGGGGSSARPTLSAPTEGAPAAPAAPSAQDLPSKGDPWAGRTDLIQPPPPAPPAPVVLPPIERFTLPNGLRVVVAANHDLPVVTMHLVVGAGNLDEPRGKRSMADLAAALLTRGTQKRSGDEIVATMQLVGGSLAAQADLESTHVVCETLTRDLATCLTLLPEVVAMPTFPQAELGFVANQLAGALKQQREDSQSLAGMHLVNLLWGEGSPRGWPRTAEAIGAVSRKDLVAWHQARFVPANAILAIAGDVDPAKLKGELAHDFQIWRSAAAPAATKVSDPQPKGLHIRLVDRPDAPDARIVIGAPGLAHKDPDFPSTLVLAQVLGGGERSRLLSAVRGDRGNGYGADAQLERWRGRGMFIVSAYTRTPETAGTLRLVLGELAKLRQSGPTAEELAAAKTAIAGRYVAGFQTSADLAAALLAGDLHGLPDGAVGAMPVQVAQVGLDEAKAAAQKHVDPENAVIVIVGKGDEIGRELEAAGLTYERVGWQDPISPNDRKAAAAATAVDAAKATQGRAILDAALAAAGGKDKLAAVKSVRAVGKVHLRLGGQAVDADWVRTLVVPDKLRLEVSIPAISQSMIMTIATDGVWQSAGADTRVLPDDVANQARSGLWREHDLILLRHLEPGTVVQATGKEKIGAGTFDTVVIREASGANETKIYLDPKTHRIVRLGYQQNGAGAYEQYADYRQVDGIWLPFRQRAEGGGQSFDVTMTDIQVNGPIDESVFTKPQPPPASQPAPRK